MSARAAADRVEIVWQVSGAEGAGLSIERRTEHDAWIHLTTVSPDGGGFVRCIDAGVEPGGRYGYRLVARTGNGMAPLGEVWVDVPRVASLALRGITPNPATGPLRVSFELAGRGAASLSLLDVAGRRVFDRDVTALGPGAHDLTLDTGRRLPAGLYFIRLRERDESRRARVVVVR